MHQKEKNHNLGLGPSRGELIPAPNLELFSVSSWEFFFYDFDAFGKFEYKIEQISVSFLRQESEESLQSIIYNAGDHDNIFLLVVGKQFGQINVP